VERAALQVSDDPSLDFALGTVRFQSGDLPGARLALEQTVALEPGFYEGWLRLALVCQAAGDPEARERALARAASLPEARDGRVERMRMLLRAGPGALR